MNSLLRARSQPLLACRRAVPRPALPARLLFLASTFALSFFRYAYIRQFLPPFGPKSLVLQGGLGFPTPGSTSYMTKLSLVLTHGRLYFLQHSTSVLLRFIWLYCSYERFGLPVELKLHRQRHRVRCYLIRPQELRPISACSSSRFLNLALATLSLVSSQPGGSRGEGYTDMFLVRCYEILISFLLLVCLFD